MLSSKAYTLVKFSELLSFSKVAKELHMTQPCVTYQIKDLEREYDIKIYQKDANKLSLTKEGELLVKYAKRMISLDNSARTGITNLYNNITSITVGITPTAEETFVTQVFAKYSLLNPDIHIKIISDTINKIYEKLKVYEVDIALVEGRVNDNNFKNLLLDTDFLCLACSPSNPISKKQTVTIDELKTQNLILRLPTSGTRRLFESSLLAHNKNINEFNVVMEIDNITTIKELVQNNYGVTIIANSSCIEEVEKGKLILLPIENLSMVREINLIYHNDFTNIRLLQDIQKIYRKTK